MSYNTLILGLQWGDEVKGKIVDALAETSEETPEQLRVNVTSPNGTTHAGLEVLMHDGSGLGPLMENTVAAAADRSRELANG